MKTGKKTGRWKYAVPVLILVLILALLGLLWNNVNNTSNSTDEIYLYGEWHSDSHILDRELEIWGEYYKKGMRDLFVEYPYTDAQFLNLWMQADDDELLDQQFKDWEGTAGGTEIVKNFLKQIKKTYPKTVFHGTDVGHTWHSTGPRYLKYLKSTGQMDTEEYQRALLNIQQGKRYARICQTNEEAAEQYREDRMVENFQRSYQELEETHRTDIMGIYGNAHIVNTGYLNAEYYMAKQLKESYGEKLHTTDLTQEPQRIDTLEVSGKTYTAFYYGEQDISAFTDYKSRKFWRLEDAYEDFKDLPKMHEFLPSDNYPVRIEAGQVFAVEYLLSDGSTEWRYYRSDGTVQDGQIQGKVIVIQSLMDESTCPWCADWYRGKIAEALGSDSHMRVWYMDRCLHGDDGIQRNTQVVNYLGALHQALLDVSDWVERGVEPLPTTNYRLEDGQIVVPDSARERRGIQPVPVLLVNGAVCTHVKVGEIVTLTASAQAPEQAGKITALDFDFGDRSQEDFFDVVGVLNHDSASVTHTYAKPGTYFAAVRVKMQRKGDSDALFTQVLNLARARVIVEE